MRAIFSRLNLNNDGLTASSSSSSTIRDDKRDRAISNTAYSHKSSNLYAEPQDILYPIGAPKYNGNHEQRTTTVESGAHQRHDAVMGKSSKTSSSGDAMLGRSGTKTFLDSFRGRKPPSHIESTSAANGGMRRDYLLSPSLRDKLNNGLSDGPPVRIVNIRSQSTPALRHDTIEEVPPPLPSVPPRTCSIPKNSSSSQAPTSPSPETRNGRSSPFREKQAGNDALPKSAFLPSSGSSSRSQLQFMEPPSSQKAISRSAPTTPQSTTDQDQYLGAGKTNSDELVLKRKSFSNHFRSRKGEQRGAEIGEPTAKQEANLPSGGTRRPRHDKGLVGVPDLASELNDLAVAHKEGLLGDDEYRMLRQGVFDRMAGRGEMELPRENRLQGMSKQSDRVQLRKDDSSMLSGSTSMRSNTSSTNKFASLFRKRSKSDLNTYAGSNNLLSTGESIRGGAAPSIQSRMSTSATLETQVSQARRARTLNGDTHLEGSSSFTTRDQPGMLNSARGERSVYSVNGASISSGNALLGANYAEKGANEIEAEITIVEAEGERILEGFGSLLINALHRYNLSYDMSKRALQGIGLGVTLEIEILDDYTISQGATRDDAFTDTNGHSQSNGHEETLNSRLSKKRSFRKAATNKGRRDDTSKAPSSYKGIVKQQSAVQMVPNPQLNGISSLLDEDDPDFIKLKAELKDIVRRRNEVSKKYADRIAFLRSNWRSAKIRQGLR